MKRANPPACCRDVSFLRAYRCGQSSELVHEPSIVTQPRILPSSHKSDGFLTVPSNTAFPPAAHVDIIVVGCSGCAFVQSAAQPRSRDLGLVGLFFPGVRVGIRPSGISRPQTVLRNRGVVCSAFDDAMIELMRLIPSRNMPAALQDICGREGGESCFELRSSSVVWRELGCGINRGTE